MLAFVIVSFLFFFFNDTATTEIYTLSLHDALPISFLIAERIGEPEVCLVATGGAHQGEGDPGRARRVLDHGPARWQPSVGGGALDHGPGHTVLHAPGGVGRLEFRDDAGGPPWHHATELHERRVADGVKNLTGRAHQ